MAIHADTATRTLPEALARAQAAGYDLVLVDTPGRDALAVNAAMLASDYCLIVTRPTIADLRAQWTTVETLKKFPGKRAAFVMNQCHHNGRRADAVRNGAIAAFPYSALDTFLCSRMEYQDAYGRALGVTEAAEGSPAAKEVSALWGEVQRQLEKQTDA